MTNDMVISGDDLHAKIVELAAEKILEETPDTERMVREAVRERVRAAVDEAVVAIAGDTLEPMVRGMIEQAALQRTNEWGEKRAEPVSFIQYLVQRAEAWLTEEVDYDGKPRGAQSYPRDFKRAGTRIAYMVDKHLQYRIEKAMKAALEDANNHIVGGIEAAVKIKLGEVRDSLKMTVKTK